MNQALSLSMIMALADPSPPVAQGLILLQNGVDHILLENGSGVIALE